MTQEKQPHKEPACEVAPLGAALTPGLIPVWSMRKKGLPPKGLSSWKIKAPTSKVDPHPTK